VRALWLSLLRFAPLPLAMVLANLIVDPVRVAGGDAYEHGIAALLLAGRSVTNIANPKDAAVVRYVIEGFQRGPEAIVLGSSRSKLIRARFFGTPSFFNNSVAGGGLTDYLALYGLYRERHFAPKLVVLEVSPWVVEPTYASIWEDRYPSRRALEEALLGDRPLIPVSHTSAHEYVVRLKEIISPGYFQTSLMTWIHRVHVGAAAHNNTYFPFEPGDVPLQETQLSDGSVMYAESLVKEGDRQQIRSHAIAYAAGFTGVPRTISVERIALFEAFVRRVERDGAHVVLYFPPYHPVTYERIVASREGALLPEVERTLRALAARTGSDTIGSYNPHTAGFGEDDFFDPSHPNADAVARLFAQRWTTSPAAADQSIRIAAIQNPNGLETLNGRSFFWIGQGVSCVSLKAGTAGWARLSFVATPGPSLPQTPRRRLLVTSTAAPQSAVVVVEGGGPFSVVVPIASGMTEACLTPLDRPTVARQANGDLRPLLLGVAAPRVETVAAPATAAPCRVTFARGWYAREGNASSWHRWMSGPAELIIAADAPGRVVLTGNTIAVKRPDRVVVTADGAAAGGFDIPAGDWAFRPFAPITIAVTRGNAHVIMQPTNPPMPLGADPRTLTVAIQNFTATMTGATVPCAIQP
jgi:hypothetical protein